MMKKLRTVIITTVFAVALWLFAEAESLGEYTGLTSVRFVPSVGLNRLVRAMSGFDGSVTINIVGSRSDIEQCQAELSRGVRLEPGIPGIPSTDGLHSVNLLQVIQGYAPLARTGARVLSISPQVVEVEVIELVNEQVQVEAVIGSVEVVGAVKVTPDRATIRLPKAAWNVYRDTLRLAARLDEAQRRRLPASGIVREEVRLEAPSEIASLPGFELGTPSVMLEFTIRSKMITESLPSIPVQLVLPPIEAGRWIVEIEPEDRFLSAEVSASADVVERLRSGAEALIAVVALSSDDLQARVATKDVSFAILEGGIIRPRADMQVTAARTSIRLKIQPAESEGPRP